MPQTARVPINEKTLQWAREQSRMERDELAKHLHVQPHRIDEFETGKAQPTFRQLTRIAKNWIARWVSFLRHHQNILICQKPLIFGVEPMMISPLI